jgi:uncharacterized membrane protein YbhN (UPF0104 family)
LEKGKENIFSQQEKEVLRSVRKRRIILPILIGLGVVFFLLWKQFDPVEFDKIKWNRVALIYLFAALILLVIRHLAYANRLRILSEGAFGWKKCIELIFIWEFSSAVTPTSIGGSAVALVVLAQEKIQAAKVATIVIYTIVLDTAFFIFTLPILYIILGPIIIRPGFTSFSELDNWGTVFFGLYILMAAYGSFFFYGLWISPRRIKYMLVAITRIKFLRKFRENAGQLGDDIIITSKELRKKKWTFHAGAFGSTAVAWSMRFLLVNFVILGIVQTLDPGFWSQFTLYARLQAMYVIIAFLPSPGGAGFAEFTFGGFLTDYVPAGIALIVAFSWRLLAYYSYLIAGVIVIPQWIRKVLASRKERRLTQHKK